MYDRGLWRYIRFFENPVDFINSPAYRDGCEFSRIFPENPVGLAGMSTKKISEERQRHHSPRRLLPLDVCQDSRSLSAWLPTFPVDA